MEQGKFYEKFKSLCDYYNSDIYKNMKITKMYYEKVKDLSIEEFSHMCKDFINNNKFMPKVAEFDYSKDKGHYGRYYTEEFLESLYDNL